MLSSAMCTPHTVHSVCFLPSFCGVEILSIIQSLSIWFNFFMVVCSFLEQLEQIRSFSPSCVQLGSFTICHCCQTWVHISALELLLFVIELFSVLIVLFVLFSMYRYSYVFLTCVFNGRLIVIFGLLLLIIST